MNQKNLYQEHHFEAEICQHLAANGWLYAEGDAARYDRANGLFLPDLLAWVEATQADSFQRLSKTHDVDKMPGGIQAVWMLSRLNRAHPGRDRSCILDFVNEPGERRSALISAAVTGQIDVREFA